MYQLRRGGPDAARNGFPHYRVSRVEGRHERERGLRGMKRAVVPIVILLLVVPILAGCGGEPKGEKPARKDVKDYELRAESAGFGFGLFRQVAAQDPGSNVVLSSVSAKLALAMAYNGAVGDTAQAMANVLDLEGKGLKVKKSERDSALPKGSVINSDPQAGQTADFGSTVTLLVSKGQSTVPNVVGLTKEEATSKLVDAGLKVSVVEDPASTSPANQGAAQDKPEGQGGAPRARVTITVSTNEAVPAPGP